MKITKVGEIEVVQAQDGALRPVKTEDRDKARVEPAPEPHIVLAAQLFDKLGVD